VVDDPKVQVVRHEVEVGAQGGGERRRVGEVVVGAVGGTAAQSLGCPLPRPGQHEAFLDEGGAPGDDIGGGDALGGGSAAGTRSRHGDESRRPVDRASIVLDA
jgi:hypothetical protein